MEWLQRLDSHPPSLGAMAGQASTSSLKRRAAYFDTTLVVAAPGVAPGWSAYETNLSAGTAAMVRAVKMVSAARLSLAASTFARLRSDKLSYADLQNGPPRLVSRQRLGFFRAALMDQENERAWRPNARPPGP